MFKIHVVPKQYKPNKRRYYQRFVMSIITKKKETVDYLLYNMMITASHSICM